MKAAGLPVLSLAVGQPAAAVPEVARQAAAALLASGRIGYTDATGRSDLRERIAQHYEERYGVAVERDRVVVTTGSSAGFNLAFLAAFDPGDRVAIAAPGYPAYRNIMKAFGIQPVEIPVGPETNYLLTAEILRKRLEHERFEGVLIASPANPTGTLTPPDELQRLLAVAEEGRLRFISDEIYHDLVFEGWQETALRFSDRAIVVNSFSKYYCMTGWRIGWMVLPPDLVRPVERLGQSLYISAPELSQAAALAVLNARAELDRVRDGYARNRDLLSGCLTSLGFGDIAPMDGAFYAYARIPEGFGSATEFAKIILHNCHVAMTPGMDFDPVRGEEYVRLSYACDERSLKEALDRLEHFRRDRQ